ncbi:MAG TPA: VanZ family protein [Gemmatimonadaceae bacterium]|nr:VanZ family protein [Gemmatimonadaceae bacterium]
MLTLTPQYQATKAPVSFCLLCGDTSILDAILNVVLFIPFGMGMRLAGISRRRIFAIALVTTVTVETLQYWIPGRDSSLGDVITNSSGAVIGALCADIWRVVLLPSVRQAKRLAWGWTMLWVVLLTVSAELAHISLPSTIGWGEWKPPLLHHDYFPGKVVSATAGGLPSPEGIGPANADVRRRLSSDSVVVQATVLSAIATGPVSAIATVYDYNRSQIFMLGQRKGNLIFSLRMRTADARVATPDIRLDSVFPRHRSKTPDTVFVAGGLIHHQLWISATRNGVRRERTQPVDAGLGWSYMLPFEYEYGDEARWLTVLWVAGLAAPAMYWGARAGRTTLLALAATLALSLAVIPLATAVHATAWWEWLGLAIGACIGALVGAVSIHASRPV